MLHIQVFHCNPLQENAYLLWDDTREGVVVDPGFDGDAELSRFRTFLKENDIRLKEIWLTHGHFDHILGVTALVRENPVPVRLHPADRPQLERARLMAAAFGIDFPGAGFPTVDLADGEELRVGGMTFRVVPDKTFDALYDLKVHGGHLWSIQVTVSHRPMWKW